jgi:hypothetical protein
MEDPNMLREHTLVVSEQPAALLEDVQPAKVARVFGYKVEGDIITLTGFARRRQPVYKPPSQSAAQQPSPLECLACTPQRLVGRPALNQKANLPARISLRLGMYDPRLVDPGSSVVDLPKHVDSYSKALDEGSSTSDAARHVVCEYLMKDRLAVHTEEPSAHAEPQDQQPGVPNSAGQRQVAASVRLPLPPSPLMLPLSRAAGRRRLSTRRSSGTTCRTGCLVRPPCSPVLRVRLPLPPSPLMLPLSRAAGRWRLSTRRSWWPQTHRFPLTTWQAQRACGLHRPS